MSTFASQHPVNQYKEHKQQQPSATPVPKNRQLFPAWSVEDDAKKKSHAIADEAAREFNLASKKVQEKTGKIEPWTPKYYAACTFGGMLACVSSSFLVIMMVTYIVTGLDPYRSHASRLGQMSWPS